MLVSDFDYVLPEELIAQTPIKNRSNGRLLVLDKLSGKYADEKFYNIISYLNKNDVLVLNNTKVLPSRLYGRKEETNAKIEVLLLNEKGNNIWEALVRPQKRVKVGTVIKFKDDFICKCTKVLDNGICHFRFIYDGIFVEHLNEVGVMPLPPYIHKELKENSRYNTVYASTEGSAAAPTAGLHFTNELLDKIKEKGIKIHYVTLNIGLGTFRPVASEKVEEHDMHSEKYYIDEETADALNKYKKEGKRIICVGTTSLRTLEANYSKYGCFKSTSEETNIFIYPPYTIKSCDSLITNFHLPKSTLIMLVSSFASKDIIMNAYKHAVDSKYKFFSFGDAMFLSNINSFPKTSYYKSIASIYDKENVVYDKNNIIIHRGENNVLISAPHAYKHIRNDHEKYNEINTDLIVKILGYLTHCHTIYASGNLDKDPNYSESSEYRSLTLDYIKNNNIKYFIDLHGMTSYNDFVAEFGSNSFNNINEDAMKNVIKIFRNNVSRKVIVDNKFKAGKKTLCSFVSSNSDVKSIQIELNTNYRRVLGKPRKFNKSINGMIKIINYLEKEK